MALICLKLLVFFLAFGILSVFVTPQPSKKNFDKMGMGFYNLGFLFSHRNWILKPFPF
jgi:hypothetical protein